MARQWVKVLNTLAQHIIMFISQKISLMLSNITFISRVFWPFHYIVPEMSRSEKSK